MNNRAADSPPSGGFRFKSGEVDYPSTLPESDLEDHICLQLIVAGNQLVAVNQSKKQETFAEHGNWLTRKILHTKLFRSITSRDWQLQELQITTEVETRPLSGDGVDFEPPSSRSKKLTEQSEGVERDSHVHPFFQLRALEERRRREKKIDAASPPRQGAEKTKPDPHE